MHKESKMKRRKTSYWQVRPIWASMKAWQMRRRKLNKVFQIYLNGVPRCDDRIRALYTLKVSLAIDATMPATVTRSQNSSMICRLLSPELVHW